MRTARRPIVLAIYLSASACWCKDYLSYHPGVEDGEELQVTVLSLKDPAPNNLVPCEGKDGLLPGAAFRANAAPWDSGEACGSSEIFLVTPQLDWVSAIRSPPAPGYGEVVEWPDGSRCSWSAFLGGDAESRLTRRIECYERLGVEPTFSCEDWFVAQFEQQQ